MTWKIGGLKKVRLRRALIARDGLGCHWCKIETRLPPFGIVHLSAEHTTIDHVIPRCRGGSDHIGNLVIACFYCNQSRPHWEREQTAA